MNPLEQEHNIVATRNRIAATHNAIGQLTQVYGALLNEALEINEALRQENLSLRAALQAAAPPTETAQPAIVSSNGSGKAARGSLDQRSGPA
jgi:hypothetical protein